MYHKWQYLCVTCLRPKPYRGQTESISYFQGVADMFGTFWNAKYGYVELDDNHQAYCFKVAVLLYSCTHLQEMRGLVCDNAAMP